LFQTHIDIYLLDQLWQSIWRVKEKIMGGLDSEKCEPH